LDDGNTAVEELVRDIAAVGAAKVGTPPPPSSLHMAPVLCDSIEGGLEDLLHGQSLRADLESRGFLIEAPQVPNMHAGAQHDLCGGIHTGQGKREGQLIQKVPHP